MPQHFLNTISRKHWSQGFCEIASQLQTRLSWNWFKDFRAVPSGIGHGNGGGGWTGKTVAANGQLIDKCASDVNDESSAQRATGNQLTRARSDVSLVP